MTSPASPSATPKPSSPPAARPSSDAAVQRPPRQSATLVLLRDGAQGVEVLLMQRAERGDHNSSAWVFPGGLVDPGDRLAHACCVGLDDTQASRQLGLAEGGLDFFIAAVRECFEESGLLLARDAAGQPLPPDGPLHQALAPWRDQIHHNERSIGELCAAHGLQLAVGQLVYLSHWLTPLKRAKRFDTRFFVAQAPAGQQPLHDGSETVAHAWLRPGDALAQGDALKLMVPTRKTLETLAGFATCAELLAWAAGPRELDAEQPQIGLGAQGPLPVMPEEPAFAEMRRIDPQSHGTAYYDIAPGRLVRLSDRVLRLTANNAGVMTGPGTNSYLVAGENATWAVIDPGPADAEHIERLLVAAGGNIRWIFTTHTHHDHSPGAALLQARTGAPVIGRVADFPERQDSSFAPAQQPVDGDRFQLGPNTTLRALHTPGHASNHLCYLLEEEQTLFTGDHLMQASTVVINPPDGDMAAYLQSLRRLLVLDEAEPIQWLAPGHGFLMARPRQAIDWLIAHRGQREAKVLAALQQQGPATLEALLPGVYQDVAAALYPVAMRSLLAHLLKLAAEGRAVDKAGQWSLTG